MTIGGDARFEQAPGAHARRFEDELVILDLAGGQYYGLDEIGAAIWERLSAGRSPAEIAHEIADEYDAPRDRVEADVRALAQEMVTRGLLIARAS